MWVSHAWLKTITLGVLSTNEFNNAYQSSLHMSIFVQELIFGKARALIWEACALTVCQVCNYILVIR